MDPWGCPAVWEQPHPQTMRRLPLLGMAPQAPRFRLGVGGGSPGTKRSPICLQRLRVTAALCVVPGGKGESKG